MNLENDHGSGSDRGKIIRLRFRNTDRKAHRNNSRLSVPVWSWCQNVNEVVYYGKSNNAKLNFVKSASGFTCPFPKFVFVHVHCPSPWFTCTFWTHEYRYGHAAWLWTMTWMWTPSMDMYMTKVYVLHALHEYHNVEGSRLQTLERIVV
jgi:hypothetical protein